MPNEIVRDGYDAIAELYAAQRDLWKSIRYLEAFGRLLPARTAVLDVGCGAGVPVDRWLLDAGHRVTGIDISSRQIELAKAACPEGAFDVRDMETLRPGEYRVDGIVSFYAVFHIPREAHGTLFRTLRSYLTPGSPLLVTMGATDWHGTEDDFHGTTMFWSHYAPVRNRDLIEAAGFEVVLDELDDSGGERHQVVLARAI